MCHNHLTWAICTYKMFSLFYSAIFCACVRLGESSAMRSDTMRSLGRKIQAFCILIHDKPISMCLLPISFIFVFDSCYPKLPLWSVSHLKFSSLCSSLCLLPVVTAESHLYFSSDTTWIFDIHTSGLRDGLKNPDFHGNNTKIAFQLCVQISDLQVWKTTACQ